MWWFPKALNLESRIQKIAKQKTGRIFIVPTRFGFFMALVCGVQFFSALAYNQNLVYFLCFFTFSLLILAMHESHSNMESLKVYHIKKAITDEAEFGRLDVYLENLSGKSHANIKVRLLAPITTQNANIRKLSPYGVACAHLTMSPHSAGVVELQRLEISSTAPFGLFVCWRYFDFSTKYYVTPKAQEQVHAPTSTAKHEPSFGARPTRSGEATLFHRPYNPTDSFRQIDWRSVARTRRLLSRVSAEESQNQYILKLSELPTAWPMMERLRHLRGAAERMLSQNLNFSIELPFNQKLVSGSEPHLLENLKMDLANFVEKTLSNDTATAPGSN